VGRSIFLWEDNVNGFSEVFMHFLRSGWSFIDLYPEELRRGAAD